MNPLTRLHSSPTKCTEPRRSRARRARLAPLDVRVVETELLGRVGARMTDSPAVGSGPPSGRWPTLGAVENSQDPHVFLHFVDRDEGQWCKTISRVPATRPGRPRLGNVRSDATPSTIVSATRRAGRGWFRRCSHRFVRDRGRRRSSNGLASTAIARIEPRSHFIVVNQPAFTSSRAALLDLAPEPFVVVDRGGQDIQDDLIHGTAGVGGQAA